MGIHVIKNPVPTPEQMGKLLGISPDRVAAVRRIMSGEDATSSVRYRNGKAYKTARKQAANNSAKKKLKA